MTKADLHVLYVDRLKFYVDSMQKSIRENDSYFTDSEMERLHNVVRDEALKTVRKYILQFLRRILICHFIVFISP